MGYQKKGAKVTPSNFTTFPFPQSHKNTANCRSFMMRVAAFFIAWQH